MKLLPYAGGGLVVFLLIFAIYVRSVPPKTVIKPFNPENIIQQPLPQGGVPEFMNVDARPMDKEGVEGAGKVMGGDGGSKPEEEEPKAETIETIEL